MIWCVEDDVSIRDIEVYTLEQTGFIDKAIAMLPDTWEAMHYGRPTKLAALAFKEMALLYDANPLMQNDLDAVVVKEYDKERAKKAAQAAWAAISYMKKK